MDAIRFYTDGQGFAQTEWVVIPDDVLFGGQVKFVHRAKKSGADFHCPPKGKSVLVVVVQGHLTLSLRSKATHTLGPRGTCKAALFEDWEPEDSAQFENRGHKSKVGENDLNQLVLISDAGTIPREEV